jgi:PAS domain S-box-containing protein
VTTDPSPSNAESARLAALRETGILDTPPEEVFDRLAGLAADICSTPVALISLVDADRQWFKARLGCDVTETERATSFCTHAVRQDGLFIIPDALADPRFSSSPLVTGEPRIRFYAGVPVRSHEGHALGTLCVVDHVPRELTALQSRALASLALAVEALLRQRRDLPRQLHRLLELLPITAYTCDADGLITYFNPPAAAVWGRTPALRHPADRYCGSHRLHSPEGRGIDHADCWMAKALRDRRPYLGCEIIVERPDGTRRHGLAHASPLFGTDGRLEGGINLIIDITRRIEAEQELRAAEARLAAATLAGRIGTWDWDLRTDRLIWSRIHEELWDYAPGEFRGTLEEFSRRIHPEDRDDLWAAARAAIDHKTEYQHEYRLVRPDGSIRWVLGRGSATYDETGRPRRMTGIVADVTGRKQSQLEIVRLLDEAKASEQRYRLLFENHPLPLWVYDLETLRFLAVNEAAVEHYGYSRAEFLAMTIADIRPPEDVPALRQNVARAVTRPTGTIDHAGEWRHRRRDGSLITVEITSHPLELDGRRVKLVLALDITEKKTLQERFLRAQRMENLGMLAAGIAHDLNNILSPALLAAPLLRDRVTTPEDRRILDAIEKSAQRGGSLVQQILSFARGHGTEKALLQPKHVLREVLELITDTFPKSIRVELVLDSSLDLVRANPTQLHQVLLNLCINARDAMPDGGALMLRAGNRPAEGKPGVAIEVADTGSGMSPEILACIWEPFFTTKGEGRGTGLGLATVREIVREHQGTIVVESAPGHGTVIRLWLPATAEARAQSVPSVALHASTPGTGQLLLVVDDDTQVRQTLVRLLTHAGYRVLAAGSGDELHQLQAAHLAQTALILMDLDLPGQDGLSLARNLQQMQPAQRILFITGSTGMRGFVVRSLPPDAPLLLKPFTREELLGAVQTALAAPPFVL